MQNVELPAGKRLDTVAELGCQLGAKQRRQVAARIRCNAHVHTVPSIKRVGEWDITRKTHGTTIITTSPVACTATQCGTPITSIRAESSARVVKACWSWVVEPDKLGGNFNLLKTAMSQCKEKTPTQ